MPAAALDLTPFVRSEVRFHQGTLGLSNQKQPLLTLFSKNYSPIRVVRSNRGVDRKPTRQLDVDLHPGVHLESFRERSLNRLGVHDHAIVEVRSSRQFG